MSIALFLHGFKYLLLPCIFYCNRTFFGRFCINSYHGNKKSPKKDSLKMVGLYSQRLFILRTFFHGTFLVPKFRTLFPKARTFLAVTGQIYATLLVRICDLVAPSFFN